MRKSLAARPLRLRPWRRCSFVCRRSGSEAVQRPHVHRPTIGRAARPHHRGSERSRAAGSLGWSGRQAGDRVDDASIGDEFTFRVDPGSDDDGRADHLGPVDGGSRDRLVRAFGGLEGGVGSPPRPRAGDGAADGGRPIGRRCFAQNTPSRRLVRGFGRAPVYGFGPACALVRAPIHLPGPVCDRRGSTRSTRTCSPLGSTSTTPRRRSAGSPGAPPTRQTWARSHALHPQRRRRRRRPRSARSSRSTAPTHCPCR